VKPDLRTIDINVTGLLYTTKLAMHYFRRQPVDISRDRCLIIKASLAGYIDMPSSPQYNTSKFGCRGLMRSLRRTSWKDSVRVNLVAPWIIATPIVPPGIAEILAATGTEFALEEDSAKAMLRIASDRTVNGEIRCSSVESNAANPQRSRPGNCPSTLGIGWLAGPGHG
jgi:NAD(P)-dependent dehydrogenase (short-subunit alcohol dehydrogenase family)